MARATIREVAREAGVSISSVSRFLSGDYRYRPETEERINQAALRLGYRAHAAARMLRQQSTNLVGIAVQAWLMSDPVVGSLVVQAQKELEQRGYQPILVEPAHMAPLAGNDVF